MRGKWDIEWEGERVREWDRVRGVRVNGGRVRDWVNGVMRERKREIERERERGWGQNF